MPKPSKKHSASKEVIRVKDVSVYYGDFPAVNRVSFSVNKGEVVAIIGPNGSGKSTLLKAMLGLVDYQGKVTVLGQPVRKVLDQIGYVPQRFKFDPSFPLTVEEFLRLSLQKGNEERLNYALEEVEMADCCNQLIGELSGGQLQRVLIARALLNNPEILFLDEATAGIDLGAEKNFYELVRHLNSEHQLTIILVSHEINMVYKFADQVVCLNRDLICFGKTKQAITKEVLEQLYGKNVQLTDHVH